jgi:hypothetical protein
MKTAMQELIDLFNHELKLGEATISNDEGYMLKWAIFNAKTLLEKEKEQIQKAFSDGQETPINHPTLPHYSREEYYDDNYKPETI